MPGSVRIREQGEHKRNGWSGFGACLCACVCVRVCANYSLLLPECLLTPLPLLLSFFGRVTVPNDGPLVCDTSALDGDRVQVSEGMQAAYFQISDLGGEYTFSTCGIDTSTDTTLSLYVYDNDGGNCLYSCFAANDDTPNGCAYTSLSSEITVTLDSDQTYFLVVGSFSVYSFSFDLSVTSGGPSGSTLAWVYVGVFLAFAISGGVCFVAYIAWRKENRTRVAAATTGQRRRADSSASDPSPPPSDDGYEDPRRSLLASPPPPSYDSYAHRSVPQVFVPPPGSFADAIPNEPPPMYTPSAESSGDEGDDGLFGGSGDRYGGGGGGASASGTGTGGLGDSGSGAGGASAANATPDALATSNGLNNVVAPATGSGGGNNAVVASTSPVVGSDSDGDLVLRHTA